MTWFDARSIKTDIEAVLLQEVQPPPFVREVVECYEGRSPIRMCLPAGASRQPLARSVVPSPCAPGRAVAVAAGDWARVNIAVAPTDRTKAAKPKTERRIVVGETTMGTIKSHHPVGVRLTPERVAS